jgi:hypothetical protein
LTSRIVGGYDGATVLHRLRLVWVLLAVLAAAPSVSATGEPPGNSITLDNRSGYHAQVKVVGPTPHTVEVPDTEQRTVLVEPGQYYIAVHYLGREDEYTDVRGESFRVEQTVASVSRVTITLQPMVGGNYLTWPIMPSDFDAIPGDPERRASPARDAAPPTPRAPPTDRDDRLTAGTVRVRVEEEFGNLRAPLGLREMIETLLRGAGLRVVGPDAATYDAALEVAVRGTPLRRRYTSPGSEAGELRYSGAEVSGTLLLEGPDARFFQRSFRERLGPPPEIPTGSYRTPGDAPFRECVEKSQLVPALGDAVAAAYGTAAEVDYWLHVLAEPALRDRAVAALSSLGAPAVAPLAARLRDNGPEVEPAVRALVGMGAGALDPLVAATKDERPEVRRRAADALGEIGDPRAVDPLLALLREEPDARVRASAARALGRMPDAVIGPLVTLLKDGSPELRRTAAEALGSTGDWRAIEPLIGALKGERVTVRSSVRDALRRLTNEDFGLDHQAWLRWWEQHPK